MKLRPKKRVSRKCSGSSSDEAELFTTEEESSRSRDMGTNSKKLNQESGDAVINCTILGQKIFPGTHVETVTDVPKKPIRKQKATFICFS